MGKKLHMQRRGKGSNAYTKLPNHAKADVVFRGVPDKGKEIAEVIELVHDPGRTPPLMLLKYDNKEEMMIAPEGIKIGDKVQVGADASLGIGSITSIGRIPESMPIYNIEVTPGDGGKLVRAAGSFATVISHSSNTSMIRLPSKQIIEVKNVCLAQIGVTAGGGATMQPILKAGKHHYMMHAKNIRWPGNRGVKSNPVDHPFGGKQHHKGASSMTSRNAPPGAKVGHIAARRVGRKKR